jgi:uncharacterized protein YkwD
MFRNATRRLCRLAAPAALAFAAIAAAPAGASAASCAGADLLPAQLGAKAAPVTLCLLNQQRAAHHLRPLRMDRKLSRASLRHSRDMAARHYFSHVSISGKTFGLRIKAAGWTKGRRSWIIGENIGWGAGNRATPRAMVRAWMHSSGHRANILQRRYRMIGIGIAAGGPRGQRNASIYATDFGG